MSENVLILSFLKKESNIKRTFNAPNFVDRIPQGRGSRGTVGTYIAESLPNVKGYGHMLDGGSGCFTTGKVYQFVRGGDSAAYQNRNITFNASLSSSTYQDNAPVQQAATAVVFCIRY